MKQQDLLRLTMQQTRQTRSQLAGELGVSKRTLDKWLLPETSSDFRREKSMGSKIKNQCKIKKSMGSDSIDF